MERWDERGLRDLLSRHGIRLQRSLGQNFLTDRGILERIAEASGAGRGHGVLEIGPGAGSLTAVLAGRAGKVVSVELDRRLLPVLTETLAPYGNVEVVPGDALSLDLEALASDRFPGLTPIVCANLPYEITTPVLEKLIGSPSYRSVTVLIQREVARRLAAPPGSPEGGAFGIFLQYHMETELLFEVPPEAFLPPPKVTSALLRCIRRDRPPVEVEDEAAFFRVIRGAFLLRRKTLVNSLTTALGLPKDRILDAVRSCGLPEGIRGERLDLDQFARLSRALYGGSAGSGPCP